MNSVTKLLCGLGQSVVKFGCQIAMQAGCSLGKVNSSSAIECSSTIELFISTFQPACSLYAEFLQQSIQLIAANLPPEIGRQLTNVCTVRFGTKELSGIFSELWSVVPGC